MYQHDSDGRVKILDFGLAKLKGAGNLTKETSTLGTVNYMSPEQAKGDEVDQCTDIWSVGVVLYEILSGQLPFKGDYEQAVMYSILNEEPRTVSEFRKELPKDLVAVINKCLQKEPKSRFNNMSDILSVLKKVNIQSMKRENDLIPFKNRSVLTWLVPVAGIIILTLILWMSGKRSIPLLSFPWPICPAIPIRNISLME
jgi:serine/threonine protein kinase